MSDTKAVEHVEGVGSYSPHTCGFDPTKPGALDQFVGGISKPEDPDHFISIPMNNAYSPLLGKWIVSGEISTVSGSLSKEVQEMRLGEGTKPSNPKDIIGSTKVPITTVPLQVMSEIGLAMLEGSLKYGRHNYREVGVRSSIYIDALFRHIAAYWEGEDIDPDSGLSHLIKALACLTILRDAEINGKLNDDRPPAVPKGWMNKANEDAKKLITRYPNPKESFTQKGKGK